MWENIKDYGEILTAAVAVISGGALVYRKARRTLAVFGVINSFMESPGFQALNKLAQSGVLEHLPAALSQLRPNGGDSLLDRIARIELAIYTNIQKNRHLFSVQRLPYWESDAHGAFIHASDALGDITGLPPVNLLGNGWVAALHPEDRERVFDEWTDAVEQKRAFVERYRFIHKDKSITYVQGQALPVLDAKGNITAFVGTLTPISESEF